MAGLVVVGLRCCRSAIGAALEPSRIVLEDHAFEQGADDLLILGRHARNGLEVQSQVVAGAAFVLIEQQRIAADAEGDGEPAQHRQRGLRLAGLTCPHRPYQ